MAVHPEQAMAKRNELNNPSRDELTDLPGREVLEPLADIFRHRDSPSPWTVMMIDVDHFKLINDVHGHLTGDQVLIEVSSILRSNLRRTDTMIRFGGDEFLGVFPETSQASCLNYAERVMERIRDTVISRNLKLSISIGIAEAESGDRVLNELIDRADRALYDAKAAGRGRISYSSDRQPVLEDGKIQLSYFVGRQSELTRIKQMLDESLTEGARFVLIEGEAGVGKTRLAHEMIHYAGFRQCRILRSEWFEFGDAEPYAFLSHPIREVLRECRDEQMRSIIQSVGAVHPATAELFSEIAFTVSDDILFFREERLKFRIFEDFSRIIHNLTQATPCLFILDDVQWISSPDLDLLKFLSRSTHSERILYVATMRSRDPNSDNVRRHLNSLRRTLPFLLLNISNLKPQETANLVMFALKDPNIPESFLDVFHRQSGGNPFFLQEMINSLIQSGSITPNPSGGWSYYLSKEIQLPESLAQLIDSRLNPLDEVTRNYLRVAALATGSFEVELICAATGDTPMSVIHGLERAIQMGLLQLEYSRSGGSMYRFSHDTICHFLHRELSMTMKAHYHGNMARYYEERYAGGERDDAIPSMAHHYCAAGNIPKAIRAALLAAKLHNRREATRETIRWLETYFSLKPEDLDDAANRFQAHLMLGDKYASIGEGEMADDQYNRAETLSAEPKDRISVQRRKALNYQMMSRYDESRACYENVRKQTEDPLVLADTLNAVAFLDYLTGDLEAARRNTADAEKLLESSECDIQLRERYLAAHYTTRGIVECCIQITEQSVAYYEKAMELFVKYGDLPGQATIYSNLADIYPRTGDYEKTLELLKKAEIIYSRLDEALGLAIVYYNTAITYMQINQPKPARQYFQKYADLNPVIKNELGLGYNNLGLGSLYEEEGNLIAAEKCTREALETFIRLGSLNLAFLSRLILIELFIQKGDINSAHREYDVVIRDKKTFLDSELQDSLMFVKGLMHLYGDSSDGSLEQAETYFAESVSRPEFMDLSDFFKRCYYLALTQMKLTKETAAKHTVNEALKLLEERLARIEKAYIRKNIRNKKYIRLLSEL